jgi:septal ring factor EnvC (AmiA/AmiB activator)
VHASAAGTVRFAGTVAGTPVVSIDHGTGLRTSYEPVLTTVHRGDHVSRGQVIGHLADAAGLPETARRTPGLSWGAVLGEETAERYIDPMTLLGPVRVRLWA